MDYQTEAMIEHIRILQRKAERYDDLVGELSALSYHFAATSESYHDVARRHQRKGWHELKDTDQVWVGRAEAYGITASKIRKILDDEGHEA